MLDFRALGVSFEVKGTEVMLVHLMDGITGFGINDLVLRIVAAMVTAFAGVWLSGGKVIAMLHKHQQKGQPIREDGPQSHLLTKKGTPTMGGVMILGAAVLSILLFADWQSVSVWVGCGVLLIYGAIGFADDYLKVTRQSSRAMTAKMKLVLQFATALAAIAAVSWETPDNYRFVLNVPYFNWQWNIGWFYVLFAMVVIAGASNGVNLSDGLDGLAAGLLSVAFTVFVIFAYAAALAISTTQIPAIPFAAEVAVMCAAVAGACLGFLRFNRKPARVFMGDTGSLALGAFLGVAAVMLKQEIILAIAGFVFVGESLSVIIQVYYFKLTKGKRFFKMAPIHHHFEQSGWSEMKVVCRFWAAGVVCALIGLAALL
ncbi:MAG: phospho-N-acetylmuramoyl-pentapeptide-transferase [Alphaproteobacteria bacterium]|nr:phospho-N-acetylmuramoyl-pentapeptide-transferase [Alphaproteobacteria bacterium]